MVMIKNRVIEHILRQSFQHILWSLALLGKYRSVGTVYTTYIGKYPRRHIGQCFFEGRGKGEL